MIPLRQGNGGRRFESTENGGGIGRPTLFSYALKEDAVDGRGEGDETGVNPGVESGVTEGVLIDGNNVETWR